MSRFYLVLEWLRSIAKSYAISTPGSRGNIGIVLEELKAARNKHRTKIDNVIQEDTLNEGFLAKQYVLDCYKKPMEVQPTARWRSCRRQRN